jgi:type I restriction enzyme S subunit
MRMTRHNENKPGYKKTKVGWIPEEWKCVPFTRLFDRASAPVIVELEGTYREIGIRSHCKGVFLKEEVIGKTLGNKRVFWCQPGTLVFNIVFAWEQAVAVLSPETEGLIASHRFPMYGAKNGCASEMFYLLFFSSPRGKHGLTLASPGGAGRNKTLGQGELDFLFLPAPPLPEQERIVVVLSAWDRAIALTDRLIDAKQRMKKGLMQQLLTGLRRFPEFEPRNTRTRKTKDTLHEGWSLLPLKQVCKLLYGKDWKSIALQTGGYPVYGSGGEIGRSSKAIDDGPAVLLGRKGTIDCPLYLQGPFWAVDTTYYAKVSEHADASFLFYLFSAIKWRRYNEASGVPSLSRNTIECLKVLLPTLVEQRKIASCLSACDREIQLLTRKRDCLKEQRKGLMQKLLTGEVKIKLQEMKNG